MDKGTAGVGILPDTDLDILGVLIVEYEKFYAMWRDWKKEPESKSGHEQIRQEYYDIEKAKRTIDKLILDWRSVRDWRKKHSPWTCQGQVIQKIFFAIQKDMILVQKEYRGFLMENQDAIFPAV